MSNVLDREVALELLQLADVGAIRRLSVELARNRIARDDTGPDELISVEHEQHVVTGSSGLQDDPVDRTPPTHVVCPRLECIVLTDQYVKHCTLLRAANGGVKETSRAASGLDKVSRRQSPHQASEPLPGGASSDAWSRTLNGPVDLVDPAGWLAGLATYPTFACDLATGVWDADALSAYTVGTLALPTL